MTDHKAKFQQIAENVEAWREELAVSGATFGVRIAGQNYSGGSGVTSI